MMKNKKKLNYIVGHEGTRNKYIKSKRHKAIRPSGDKFQRIWTGDVL